MLKTVVYIILLVGFWTMISCSVSTTDTTDPAYSLAVPSHFPRPTIPSTNPLTVNKIQLGRMLFYDKRISEDLQIACASCHKQEFAFGSNKKLDTKVHGASTVRNSSVLFNLAFTNNFFWDGRTNDLEATCLDAMKGEQKFNIDFVKTRLMTEQAYKDRFKLAFNTTEPTEDMVVKAIASFIRTMVSANSNIDNGIKEGDINKYLSADARDGRTIFATEEGDCFHCHGDPQSLSIMTDNLFHNNGLDSFKDASQFLDKGFGGITGGNASNIGKFKTPPLRNLSFSAPFMHDGRIATLDGVLKHYNSEVYSSVSIDANMKKVGQGGLQLTPDRLAKLKAYLLSFDDPSFIQDTAFKSPF